MPEAQPVDMEMPPPLLKKASSIGDRQLVRGMDSGLYNRIWGDNEAFVMQSTIYNPEYFKFLLKFIQCFGKMDASQV